MPSAATKLGATGNVKLDATAFGAEFNMPLVHETVRAEQAARRRGTASTKTRGQVRGGGAKPWKQKGTGRARAGSSRSPIWTGGGTVFGPQPRGYTFKVNRKARRVALRSALSVHAERGSVAVFDAGVFDEPSTKQAQALLEGWGADATTLVVLTGEERDCRPVVPQHRPCRGPARRGRRRRQRDRRRAPAGVRGRAACAGRTRQRNLRGR